MLFLMSQKYNVHNTVHLLTEGRHRQNYIYYITAAPTLTAWTALCFRRHRWGGLTEAVQTLRNCARPHLLSNLRNLAYVLSRGNSTSLSWN